MYDEWRVDVTDKWKPWSVAPHTIEGDAMNDWPFYVWATFGPMLTLIGVAVAVFVWKDIR